MFTFARRERQNHALSTSMQRRCIDVDNASFWRGVATWLFVLLSIIKVSDRDYRFNDNKDNHSDNYCLNDDYNAK